uniref:Promethin n=1 Tax=Panagrolaimus sp. PS1159 TaxID=55785 RepID=A0AC35GT91_9BILA
MGKITEIEEEFNDSEQIGLARNQQIKLIFITLMIFNSLPMLGLAAYVAVVVGTILTSALFFQFSFIFVGLMFTVPFFVGLSFLGLLTSGFLIICSNFVSKQTLQKYAAWIDSIC